MGLKRVPALLLVLLLLFGDWSDKELLRPRLQEGVIVTSCAGVVARHGLARSAMALVAGHGEPDRVAIRTLTV